MRHAVHALAEVEGVGGALLAAQVLGVANRVLLALRQMLEESRRPRRRADREWPPEPLLLGQVSVQVDPVPGAA
eukprot:10441320-Alexandrium_andersonii.AAC.1